MILVLIVLLILCVVGVPHWGLHSYGYAPSGVLGVILVIVVVLWLLGRL